MKRRKSSNRIPWFRAVCAGVGLMAVLTGVLKLAGRVARADVHPLSGHEAPAEVPPMQAPPVRTLDGLATLSAAQLEGLYRQGVSAPMPAGRVRGLALYPDSRFPRAKAKASRVAWQGKIFDPATSTATNRFFGANVIKGNVYAGQSWLDGNPALILDYQGTSKVYGNYRDEIRQVAPGVYLGLMHDRTTNPPAFKMYFAFSDL